MGNNGSSYTIYVLTGKPEDCAKAEKELQQIAQMRDADNDLVGLYALNIIVYDKCDNLEQIKNTLLEYRIDADDYIESVYAGDTSVEIHVQDFGSANPEIVHYYAKSRNLNMNYASSCWDGDCYMIYNPDHVLDEFEVNVYDGVEERDCSFYDLLENEQSYDHISTIYDGEFLDWCNKNGHIPTKENLRSLSVAFTESELSPDDVLWITPYTWDTDIEELPENPPKFD